MPPAARMGLYRAKCDPETLEIITRARRMRANHPLLDTIYILSNADYNFIEETKRWLATDGWHVILTSGDVASQWEDQEIGEAVDTEIARRAGVFVGNGVSTAASSNFLRCPVTDAIPNSSRRCRAMSRCYVQRTDVIGISHSTGDSGKNIRLARSRV
jgi:hypothetical protein